MLQLPYNKPLPEDLIRKIAERRSGTCVKVVATVSGNSAAPMCQTR
jgi:hypothetical protein